MRLPNMLEKIRLSPETRSQLISLGNKLGLYLEGNIIKLIDAEDDEAFQNYLRDAAARDLTIRSKRLKITKQIQEQNKSLTALNEQLRSSITDLEQARDQAEEALRTSNRQNEGIVQFSWMLSHNLRGPVASLLGVINLLGRDDSASPALAGMIRMLHDTAGKIDSKIKEISEVLETHILQPEQTETFGLDELVNEVFEDCSSAYHGEPAEFISGIPADMQICFPVNAMKKILRALFENALTFRRDGVLHQIRASYVGEKYEHRLRISDNGIGIPENLLGRIFEPFKVCSDKSTGRGMGLYIVKSLLEGVNGRIEVESTEGAGTTFTLVMPVMH